MDFTRFQWTREPAGCKIEKDRIEIITKPYTDLWQRTYYHFRNDNAPVFQMETDEKYFSFLVKTDFSESGHRFDQCGIAMYLDSENWLKASVEYENEEEQHLGSVVTNGGYSDWATTVIGASVKSMWYRFSRREDDYRIECSADGVKFDQNENLPYAQGRWENPLRHLCLLSGGFLLQSGVHGHEVPGMPVEGARRATARSGLLRPNRPAIPSLVFRLF